MALKKAAAFFGQADRLIPVPRHAPNLDQMLFAQVAEVARTRVGRTAVVVAEITTGDHSERADRRERSRFRAAEGVLPISIVNRLATASAW